MKTRTAKPVASAAPISNTPQQVPLRRLSINEACGILGCGRTFLYKEIARKRLPAPLKLGRASGLLLQDLHDYLARVTLECRG